MKKNKLHYWLALNKLGFMNFRRLKKLQVHFPELTLFQASKTALQTQGKLPEKYAEKIMQFDFESLAPDLRWLEEQNHHIITIEDEHYPTLLTKTADPPLVLYASGQLSRLALPQFAIVGSRKPTPKGEENAYNFASSMAKYGFSICSGLAYGIDAASHQGALLHGTTVAVLGTGMNEIYPKACRKLAQHIENKGLLISEFPVDTKPLPENFPRRNRIISGLSIGTLVVEAALASGSLITAKCAIEQGREVFAIPGSIHNPQSKGCHWLIRQGAVLTETVEDIVQELGSILDWLKTENTAAKQEKLAFGQLDEDDSAILSCMGDEPISIDKMVQISGLPVEKIAVHLMNLELKSLIKSVQGGYARAGRRMK